MDVNRVSSTAALSTKSTAMTPAVTDSSDEDDLIALKVAQRVNGNGAEADICDSSESPDEEYDTDYESWDEKEGFPSSVEEIEDQHLLAMAEGKLYEHQIICHALKYIQKIIAPLLRREIFAFFCEISGPRSFASRQ